jgi:hypothetical protein
LSAMFRLDRPREQGSCVANWLVRRLINDEDVDTRGNKGPRPWLQSMFSQHCAAFFAAAEIWA